MTLSMLRIWFLLRIYSLTPVVLNLVGGTEPHNFHTCIYRTLRSWKNKMCAVNFFFLLLLLKISWHRTLETDSPNPCVSIEPRLRITDLRARGQNTEMS